MGNRSVCLVWEHLTPIGQVWTHWNERGLARLSFDGLAAAPDLPSSDVPSGVGQEPLDEAPLAFDALLQDYFHGGTDRFATVEIDFSAMTEFTRRVYDACRSIPHGQTRTYRQLAVQVGRAGAARAVGAALARNRLLLVIPCHRVVGSSGQLCGFSAPGGLATKRALLDLEREMLLPSFRAEQTGLLRQR